MKTRSRLRFAAFSGILLACAGGTAAGGEVTTVGGAQSTATAQATGGARLIATAAIPQPDTWDAAVSLAATDATDGASHAEAAAPALPQCQVQCVGAGEGTRLQMEPKLKYTFTLLDMKVAPHELHVLSVQNNSNVMIVEQSQPGQWFTTQNDSLRVCSRLRGTGGGCAWSCAYDIQKREIKVFTDQLYARFSYTCE